MSGLEMAITAGAEERPDKGVSLCVIKEARLSFMADMLKWAAKWGQKNGYHMRVGNTPNGFYEILGFETDPEEEPGEQPDP